MLLLIGIPVVDACSGDARGVVACVRDQINHKFGLPAAPDALPSDVSVESAPAPPEPSAAIDMPTALPGLSPVAKPVDAPTPVAEAPGAGEQTPGDAKAPAEVVALPAVVADPPVAPADAPVQPAEAARPQAVADVPRPPALAPESASGPLPAVGTEPAAPVVPTEPIPLAPAVEPVAAAPSVPDAEPPPIAAAPESAALTSAPELAIEDQPQQPEASSSDVAALEEAPGLGNAEPLELPPATDPPLTPPASNLDLLAVTPPVANLPAPIPDPGPLPAEPGMPPASPGAPLEIAETPTVPPSIVAIAPPPDLPPPMPPVLQPRAVQPVDPIELSEISPAPPSIPADMVKIPILAPTIDAIEIEGDSNFVAGDGPEGATVRLYVDDQLMGESAVAGGRWLVEGIDLLGKASSTLRIEAIDPATGKLLGSAVVSFEIELPKAPEAAPDTPPTAAPDATAEPTVVPPAIDAQSESDMPVPPAAPGADDVPTADAPPPDGQPQFDERPDAATEALPVKTPAPLPPITPVTPTETSASVTILAPPASDEPEILPPIAEIDHEPAVQVLPLASVANLMLPVRRHIPLIRAYPIGELDARRFASGKAIIRRGDTLWSIARRYYGHGIHFWTIVHANRDLIRRPSRIYPGQVFALPLVTDD